jgi:hypothetical protein
MIPDQLDIFRFCLMEVFHEFRNKLEVVLRQTNDKYLPFVEWFFGKELAHQYDQLDIDRLKIQAGMKTVDDVAYASLTITTHQFCCPDDTSKFSQSMIEHIRNSLHDFCTELA